MGAAEPSGEAPSAARGAPPLVSIVTPVYNGADHLKECIESVLAQSYSNWEYIILNNCSTDGSETIAREYAAKDARIRVHSNTQFLKVIANHNAALRLISAQSKYCKIVFADDWISPECIERMVAVAEQHPTIGVVGAYGLKGEDVKWTGLPYPSHRVPGRDVSRRLLLEDVYVFGTPTSVLYRADLVRERERFYNEENIHADMEVCLSLLRGCDFGFVHQVLTFTRVRQESLSSLTDDLNTISAGYLRNVARYGRDYLNEEEFKACLARRQGVQYACLVGGLIRGRSKEFWEYHKRSLTQSGVKFGYARLALVVFVKVLRAILNPLAGIDKAVQVGREILARRRWASPRVRSSQRPNRTAELG